MDEPIEELYFNWLYAKLVKVDIAPTPSLTYYTLFRDLHTTEFAWLLSGDDNRAEEGMELRKQFLRQAYLDENPMWLHIPCSVLEMLIAFTTRAAYEYEHSEREWFWIFMRNLELDQLNDSATNISRKVSRVMEKFVWRTYKPNGQGGLFPLHNYERDQTRVEIWYQFCEYLVDQNLI